MTAPPTPTTAAATWTSAAPAVPVGLLGSLVLGARFGMSELRLVLRNWHGQVFSILLAPLLYLASIGLGLGSLVDGGGASEALGGLTYAAFAGTGLMVGNAMLNGAGAMAWPVYGALTYEGTWHTAVATPLSPRDLLVGRTMVVAARTTVASTVFALSLAVLGLVPPVRALASVGPAVLIATAAGMSLFTVSATTSKDFALPLVFRFAVTPMFLVSGTFFPIDRLPDVLQPLAALSPLWHALALHRSVSLAVPTAWPWGAHLVVLLAWIVVFGVLAVRALSRRLYQ